MTPVSDRALIPLLEKVYSVLERPRKLQRLGQLALMLVSAIAEFVTLGAILPFVGALIQPNLVLENAVA